MRAVTKQAICCATLSFCLWESSASAAVTFVGNDIATGSSWRTSSVTKPNDVDGDNVYGSAGYFLPSATFFRYRNPLLSGTNAITPDPKGVTALPSYISGLEFADAEPGASWGGEFNDCGTLDLVAGSIGLTGAGILPSATGTGVLNLRLKRSSSPAFRLTLIFGNNPNALTFFETSSISEDTTVANNAGIPRLDDPLGVNVTVNDGSGALSQLSGDPSLGTNTTGYTTYQSWDISAGSSDISITIDLNGTTSVVPRLSGIAIDSAPATAPTVLIAPVGGTYFQGNPVVLDVNGGGTGIGYQWLKNSNNISGATNYEYSILNSTNTDSGAYQVLITNSVGSITSVVAQVIVVAPPVTLLLQDTLTNGVAGALSGRTPDTVGTSNWIANANWVTDGTEANDATVGQANAFLPFVPQPGRVYTLSADIEDTDVADPNSWTALGFANGIDVNGSWHLVNNPVGWWLVRADNLNANQTFVGPGTGNGSGSITPTNRMNYKVILDTTPVAASNWTITFLADGVVRRSASAFGGSGPTITRVGFGKIAQSVGHVRNFTLSQQVPFKAPFFTTEPVGGTNFVGETKTLSAVVGGSDPLSFKWQKNTIDIPNATNSVLTLTNLQTADSGSYQVIVTNFLGSSNSTAVSIQVITPVVDTIYQDGFTNSGDLNAAFPGGADAWIASTNGTWTTDGTEAVANTAASANAYLPFVPQAGKLYTLSADIDCTAGNWIAFGFANSNITGINWQNSPNNPVGWFLARPDGGAVNDDQTFIGPGTGGGSGTGLIPAGGFHHYAIILDTRPTGGSAWTFQYLIDSNAVRGPIAFGGTGPVISTVGLGSFSSSFGYVQNFTLTVAYATPFGPAILTQPAGGTLLAGTQASLVAYAGGSAPLSYLWQKNSNNITGATTAQLTFPSLAVSDSGYYRLTVSNALGGTTSTNVLITVVTNLPIVQFVFDSGDVLPSIPVDTNNLILTSLASVSPATNGNNFTGLFMRNGTTGTALENSASNPANVMNSGTYDFIFNTSVNAAGYDISAVVTYSGWSDRAGQNHTVFYRQAGTTNFVSLGSVVNTAPGNPGSLRAAVTNIYGGTMASHVDAIRIVVNQSTFVYREIEVDGTAVPRLDIALQGGSVLLSWSTAAVGYGLTSSSVLGSGASWPSIGGVPTVVGSTNQVTIPVTNSTQFFRLTK